MINTSSNHSNQGRSTPIRTGTPQSWQEVENEKKAVQEVKRQYSPPPEGVQDKILFIFNNISQDNLAQKVRLHFFTFFDIWCTKNYAIIKLINYSNLCYGSLTYLRVV